MSDLLKSVEAPAHLAVVGAAGVLRASAAVDLPARAPKTIAIAVVGAGSAGTPEMKCS